MLTRSQTRSQTRAESHPSDYITRARARLLREQNTPAYNTRSHANITCDFELNSDEWLNHVRNNLASNSFTRNQ
jgi:hypothetical protein